LKKGSLDSSFTIVTRLQVGRSGVRFPTGTRDFTLLRKSRLPSDTSSLLLKGYPKIKRPELEAEHAALSNAEFKNE
jgi:hypothetical protein